MKIEVTENQMNFLLDYFFVNTEYAGWRNIAIKLIKNGKCIVPGSFCIWAGGVGNFIEVRETDEAVDCIEYVFNLKYFLSSNFFIDVKESYLEEKRIDLEILSNKIEELTKF